MTQNRNLSILADNVSSAGVLTVAGGGTGLSSTPANGQIPIGNGTNYTAATITAGAGITVTNGAGSITVALPTPGTSLNYLVSNGTNWVSSAFGAASLAASGYQKLPNGFILQWGSAGTTSGAGVSASPTFPIAFPTACQSVIVMAAPGSLATQYTPGITVKSTTGFTWGSAGSGFGTANYYIAVGY